MPHHTPLIATIVMGLVLAFIFGALAQRVKIPPIVGYLLAGVAVGPHTPGFVADANLATELAEIGVILLMFGVGLHFSLKDLMAVRKLALPGAAAQIAFATLLGMALAWALDWTLAAGLVFGLALSVASTVVLLRALNERHLIDSERGRIAVGWLIVEDLVMVIVLVMLPALAQSAKGEGGTWQDIGLTLAITLGKVAIFVALMLVVGRRVIPWLLHYIAHTGSRELFRLSVLAIALGVALGAAQLFGVSFALGAFFAGMVMSESELSQQAAEETLPLRDAFAVLFFVSVGMLFNPAILVDDTLAVIATVLVIVVGKSVVAYAIVRAFRHPPQTALTISVSLAQIGEFSFILAGLGVSLALLPERAQSLILAGAILSIFANPFLFNVIGRLKPVAAEAETAKPAAEVTPTALTGHIVLVGYGRVGNVVAEAMRDASRPILAIEEHPRRIEELRAAAIETLVGNGADPEILAATNLKGAAALVVATPNGFEAGQIVEQARAVNPALPILARAHSDEEVDYLKTCGADTVIMGEREIARAMIEALTARNLEPKAAS